MNGRRACKAEGGQRVDQTSEALKAVLSICDIPDRYAETAEQLHGLAGSNNASLSQQTAALIQDDATGCRNGGLSGE